MSGTGQLLFGFSKSLSDVVPVEDIEDLLNVLSTEIFVLDVVGVLPNVNAEKRN